MSDVGTDQAPAATAPNAVSPSVELMLETSRQAEEARSDHRGEQGEGAGAAGGGAKANTGAKKLARRDGDRPRRWPGLVSIAASTGAFIFSGVSLYETVLKPAKLMIYVSDTMLFGHGEGHSDAIVVPITIANHGSRVAVVTKIHLTVRRQGALDVRTMGSTYSGDTPRAHERLFTPIPVAGHQSYAAGVVFVPTDSGGTIFSKGAYEFCLTLQAETDDFPGLFAWLPAFRPGSFRFESAFPDLDPGQLNAGTVVTLKIAGHSARSCGSLG
jgi:hypothetical protein